MTNFSYITTPYNEVEKIINTEYDCTVNSVEKAKKVIDYAKKNTTLGIDRKQLIDALQISPDNDININDVKAINAKNVIIEDGKIIESKCMCTLRFTWPVES